MGLTNNSINELSGQNWLKYNFNWNVFSRDDEINLCFTYCMSHLTAGFDVTWKRI